MVMTMSLFIALFVLSPSLVVCIFTISLVNKSHVGSVRYLHFADEETEAQ